MRIFLLLLAIVSFTGTMQAQLPNNNLEEYEEAKAGLYVFRNEQQLLPVNDLDDLRPAIITLGFQDDSEFCRTLNTYIPTAYISWNSTTKSFNTTWPFPQKQEPNLIIIALSDKAAIAGRSAPPIDELLDSSKTPFITAIFGNNPEATALITAPPFKTVLYSLEDTPWSQSLAAQLIFGAIPATNEVGDDFNEYLSIIDGIKYPSLSRLAFAPPAALGMDTELLKDSISSIVEDGLANQAFPGAQVLVAKSGTVVYHQTFGHHTEKDERAVQKTDLYDLASVSKITSALPALIKWYSEGTFDLDAPLERYYPAAKGSNKADLSFRAMLSHHARLRPWIPYWQGTLRGNGKYPWSRARDPERINDYRFRSRTLSRDSSAKYNRYLTPTLWQHKDYEEKMMRAIMKSPLNEKAEYRYSGLLFYLLPEIVRQQSGMEYEKYLRQTFYRPLGAYTLGFNPSRYFPLNRIIPTERDSFFRMQLLHGYVHDEGAAMMGGFSANAGLFANSYDLAKIMQLYLNGGTYGGQRYFSAEAMKTFTSRHYADQDNRRGLGFDKPLLAYNPQQSSVAEAASAASFGHSGYTGTFTWADPEEDLLFIFLSNRVYPSRKNRGIYTRNIRPRIHTAIYQAILEKNGQAE